MHKTYTRGSCVGYSKIPDVNFDLYFTILKYERYHANTSISIIRKSQDLLFLIAPGPFNSSGLSLTTTMKDLLRRR